MSYYSERLGLKRGVMNGAQTASLARSHTGAEPAPRLKDSLGGEVFRDGESG